MDEAHLAIIGMPGGGSVEMQGEVFRETQHRGVWMRVVVERIALGGSCERTQSRRELLVVGLVGSLRRRFG